MTWSVRIFLAVVIVVLVGGTALLVYANTIRPPHKTYEQVISNDRFPK
jgi:hypothetical protein